MIVTTSLLTERLSLSALAPDDVGEAYVGWLNDPRVNRFLEIRLVPQDLASTRAFVQAINESDHSILFAIRLARTSQHIGNIKLGPINRYHRRADIGLMIGEPSAWGCGYASEAIVAVTRFGHAKLGLAKVTAGIYAGNHGSIGAFRRAGFVEEARLSRHWRDGESWDDDVLVAHFADQA